MDLFGLRRLKLTFFAILIILLDGYMFHEDASMTDIFNLDTTADVDYDNESDTSQNTISNEVEIPSQPLNLTVGAVTDTTMELSWLKPQSAHPGQSLDYYIYYLRNNNTGCKKHSSSSSIVGFCLTDLEPYAEYKVWVKATSQNVDGEASEPVIRQTDVSGPGPPHILNATCITPDTLAIFWQQPPSYNRTIDKYIITYREEDSYLSSNITIPPCNCSHECSALCLTDKYEIHNLTSEMYEVKIAAASRSIYDEKKEIAGRDSESRKVEMKNCGLNLATQFAMGPSAGVIAGLVCVCFAFLLAIIAFIIWRNCLHAAYYYLEDSPPVPQSSGSSCDWESQDPESTILLKEFATHVASLHADGDIGFSKEYEAIQNVASQSDFTTEFSQYPDNKSKNRYLNILAYDHSRVRLLPLPGQSRWSDYINANYIDGFQRANAYIGTQGPLPCTFEAFWRMVWEQGVAIIVMITNLVERGRRKCDMYWPKEGTETYGLVQVKLIKEDVLAMYTVRTLQILHTKTKRRKHGFNERLVYQYHYTNWPDHGTPDHPLPILSFVKKSSAANPCEAGPIVVHCSAGVGRTGTYIVLDSMLKQISHKKQVNVFGFLRHIRTQRNFLVQTEEQYIFIHDALLEAITCSEASLSADCLAHLLSPSTDHNHPHWAQLQAHFKAMTAFEPQDYNLLAANKASNQIKNRNQQLIPVECSRVHLTPKPGMDGSDYINASWCLGFKKLREFIVTQHPLEGTVLDFWQMVWDHNVQTVVLLSPLTPDTEEYSAFWPDKGETLDGDSFKVKLMEESELDGTVSRDLTIQSVQDDYELAVRIIQSPVSEPLSDLPALIQLINTVQQWHLEYQNGPIIVIDKFGGTEAATFCCLTTLMKQLDYENHADVCMYAKLYHNRRPGIWQAMDDYLLLYQGLEVLSVSKGVSLVPSPPSPTHLQPNGYTSANLGSA